MLFGCAAPPLAPGDWGQAVGSTWTLTGFHRSAPAGMPQVQINFSEDGRVAGSVNGQRIFGTYETTTAGGLRFASLGTAQLSPSIPDMPPDQTRKMLDTLYQVKHYRVEDQTLRLYRGRRPLIFRRTATPPK